ncbi:hypothetical protein BG58_33050 [Caballeronia jiangsuensis]|nr:hypothetical protein BG58_33050 [Caballeronia jiangsuensis]
MSIGPISIHASFALLRRLRRIAVVSPHIMPGYVTVGALGPELSPISASTIAFSCVRMSRPDGCAGT